MRYLKRFNESVDIESQLRDFSETYLAYLLDDGYKIKVSKTNLKTQFMIKLYKITEINEEEYESNEFTWLDVKDSYIPFLHMLNRDYDIIDDVVEFYDGGDDELVEVDVEKVLSGDVLPHGRDNESILEILVWVTFDKPIKESVELKLDDVEHYLAYLLDEDFEIKSVIKGGGDFLNVQPQQSISMERNLSPEEWQDMLRKGLTHKAVIIGVKSAPMRVHYSDRFKAPVPLSNYNCELLNKFEFLAQDCTDKLLLSLSDHFSSTKIIMSFKEGSGHHYTFFDMSIRLQIILIE
jgi:hypothetical protein